MSKSQLMRECIKHPPNSLEYQAYMSAILCKYWYLIKTYKEIDKQFATEEDIYEWMCDALMYTLKNHKWDDSPEKYKENAPASIFSTVFKCTRITAYQSSNRHKRKINPTTSSIEKIYDDYNVEPFYREDSDDLINNVLSNYHIFTVVKHFFNKHKFLHAFVIDNIVNGDVFGKVESGIYLNTQKLRQSLNKMDEQYAKTFSEIYDIPLKEVTDATKTIVGMSNKKLNNDILLTLKELSVDNKIRDMLS
jgi:hypothetical protein